MRHDPFDFSSYSGRQGDAFPRLDTRGARLVVELVELAGKPAEAEPAVSRVPFSPTFRGPRGRPLSRPMHRFENEALGAFDLSIVPIGPDDLGLRYRATFH